MLRLSIIWVSCIDLNLWPMANSYATYSYNRMPNDEDITPSYIFTGTNFPHHKPNNLHTCGCPVYILYPTLQQGHELSKWQPQSCCGIFVGFIPNNLINVYLILNPYTGHIYLTFHLIFDDCFITVLYISTEEEPISF